MSRLGSTAATLKLKGIDGDLHKRWSMWFNSTISEEPYQGLKSREFSRKGEVPQGTRWQVLHGCRQLVVWIARLIPETSATPIACYMCQARLPRLTGRKAGMTPNQHGPWRPGPHTCYNGRYKGFAKPRGGANPIKAGLSSDWSLQLDFMKSESLVIVNQLCHGEYVLRFCTHRPSHQESR